MVTANGAPTDVQTSRPSVPQIFWAFLRLGLTAFGGPAMVSYIGEMTVTRKRWLSRPSFKEGVAVAQTIPGATAMQTAAYVGLRVRGLTGAAAAYIGFGLPAFVFMVVLSILYGVTNKLPVSHSVFQGLQVIVVAIVARAAFTFGRSTLKGWQDALVSLTAAAYLAWGGNPILAVMAGAVVGILLYRPRTADGDHNQIHETSRFPSTTRQVVMMIMVVLALLIALLLVNRRLFDLSALMMKVDVFAFGGGFASVPVMLHEVVGVRHWMNTRAFMDGIAMGQVTPGPIVITATFIGYQIAGVLGALCGTIAVFFRFWWRRYLPSSVSLTVALTRDHRYSCMMGQPIQRC